MTRLLQVSDPHFGTERPQVVEALLAFSRACAPDVLVLSGDITQRARAAQFRAARAFVDALAIPVVLAVPGNHDMPLFNFAARLLWPYAGYRRAFGDELEPSFESVDLLVLGVNTTRRWRHEDGHVSAAQVERVAQRLRRAAPGQLRIVVTHQPIAVARAQDEKNLLHGADAALPAWAGAGADLVLGGHIHLPYLLPMHERRAGLARKLWVLQAGTAVSSRIRHEADNSVNLIHCTAATDGRGRRATVERWDYSEIRCVFERAAVDEIHPDADRLPAEVPGGLPAGMAAR